MKHLHILILVNLLYLIPATFLFVSRSNLEFVAYGAIVILLGLLFVRFYNKGYLLISELWLLSFWGFLHLMGGLILFSNGTNLYQQMVLNLVDNGGGYVLLKMDQVIHFYGFGLASYIMYRILSQRIKDASSLFVGVFAVIIAIGFGALNEVIEFIVVLSTPFNGVGDLYNMGLDLIFNFAGAIVGSLIQYIKLK